VWTRRAVFVIVAAAVGSYYLWGVRAAGNKFDWGYDLGGYYDYLGRGFAHGHLYVPITPSPKLLALPNPWDPAVDDSLKMQDMALFNGRYYLYHGAGPALILFAPWRLVTGHDLPESFALFLLCFGGFLFSCGALLRLLDLAAARPGPWLLAGMLLALGICQSVPYLLSRVWVYEIAIGGGYFSICGAVFFLARGIGSRRSVYWLAPSGLMFGLAIACRPHLGLAGAMALIAVAAALTRRQLATFVIPLTLAGAVVAAYNYARFGNPFEFPANACGDFTLDLQLIRLPLMMKTGLGQSGIEGQAEVDRADNHEQRLTDDGWTARRAHGENGFSILQHNRGAHAGERALAGLDGIGFRADQSEEIAHARLGRKIIHLVIEHNPGARHDHFGAK